MSEELYIGLVGIGALIGLNIATLYMGCSTLIKDFKKDRKYNQAFKQLMHERERLNESRQQLKQSISCLEQAIDNYEPRTDS